MARPKAFDADQALDAAIGVFREHGFEGTSAEMLVRAMGVGRQSLYDTFGDKWRLYCAAVRRYADRETSAHLAALRRGPRARDGLVAMVDRVVETASSPCLGVAAVCEFGRSRADLTEIHDAAGRVLHGAIAASVREAQAQGDIAADLDPQDVSAYLAASFAGLRLAARGGADARRLRGLADVALRALS
ncbi:TetR/AcrR family transcriptional regulator [Phenylobacterium sp.]|uniref:TetR/AcrR family transcriptional regulator n=1 Tax=Phenylobacterium sp. TaxID=1871053 RepID=UPI002897F90D|nr:TetR/AcrR family transcriptional regulator [Phenylobacterium sp.]